MTATYDAIATTSVTGTPSTIDFTSISGSFTDLVVVLTAKTSAGTETLLRFNSDTGNNYSTTILYGTGTTAGSYRDSNQSRILTAFYGNPTTDNSHVSITHIQNYSNTNTNKTILCRSNRAAGGVDAIVGLWRNTAAITSVTILTNGGTFTSGTVATLYGIKAE
jgi:hypothetical protein